MSLRRLRFGISVKLMLATFALLVGALASLAWTTYRSSAQMVAAGQHASMENLLQHTERTLATLQEQMSSLLLSVAANHELWDQSNVRVETALETYRTFHPLVGSLYLIRNNGEMVGVPRPYVRALGRLLAPEMMARLADRTGLIWTEPYRSRLSHWTVTVATRVYRDDGSSPGYVAMDIPLLNLIDNALPTLSFDDSSTLLVVTEQQALVVADFTNPLLGYRLSTNRLDTEPEVIERVLAAPAAEFVQVAVGDEEYSVLAGPSTAHGWRPILLFSNRAFQAGRLLVGKTTVVLLILVGLVSLALAWLVARYFARPLEVLTQEMARVQKGRLEGIHVPKRNDEIGDLAVAFDEMMARVRSLLDELRHSEQAKKEIEIRLLQAQIKPHFLYNTLNAIGHSAALGRTQDVYDMIQSLTRVLSFTFGRTQGGKDAGTSRPEEEVMLAEELAFLEHYVRLQQIRYGRTFQVAYAVEPGVGRCKVLKLSLQPLVENAILHGLSQRTRGGILHIGARQRDGLLELRIADNGPGIDPQHVAALETGSGQGAAHLGLRNVRERLALHYGSAASLTLESLDPSAGGTTGTHATIRLPIAWEAASNAADVASGESFLALAQQRQSEPQPRLERAP